MPFWLESNNGECRVSHIVCCHGLFDIDEDDNNYRGFIAIII